MPMDVVGRLREASPRTVDALVVAAVAVPTLMDAWWNEQGTRQADAATYTLAVVSVVALFGRRPLAVRGRPGVGRVPVGTVPARASRRAVEPAGDGRPVHDRGAW
jgi:hypothetical protein